MDVKTLGAAIALMKKVGGSKAAAAAQSAREAAASAETAASRNYGVSVSGTKIVFTPNES